MGAVTYHTYCRIIGSTITLLLHGVNCIVMFLSMRGDILKDPDIATLKATQLKFFTIWNVGFQLTYSIMSLLCDVPLLLKMKEESQNMYYINYLRRYRKVFFGGVIVPSSLLVFIIFWPFFLYDRELLFPAFIDKALSKGSNHIMHTAILPIMLWELIFYPRSKPSSHRWYLSHMVFIFMAYLALLLIDHAYNGTWPYPFVKYIYGTITFPIIVLGFAILYLGLYFIQWPVSSLIYGKREKLEKIR